LLIQKEARDTAHLLLYTIKEAEDAIHLLVY